MTHFTVLVRFEGDLATAKERVEQMLAPYDENLEVAQYKHYYEKDEIKRMAEHYKIDLSDLKSLAENMKDWHGTEGGVDEKGLYYLSTYNPRSKWDWWSIGGRWSGRLILKRRAKGIKGEPGVFKNPTGIDIAYLKDIDLEKMQQVRLEQHMQTWDEFIEKAEVGKDPGIEFWLSGVEEGDTLETFLARAGKDAPISACAVLDELGWHEPAKMGWFGSDYDRTEDEETWNSKFAERFLSNPTPNTIVAMVDCHI